VNIIKIKTKSIIHLFDQSQSLKRKAALTPMTVLAPPPTRAGTLIFGGARGLEEEGEFSDGALGIEFGMYITRIL
jgi:hypothetical protein